MMSSIEVIGSLITLSPWSRLEGQAHREVKWGGVYSPGSVWSPMRLSPEGPGITRRQVAGRWYGSVVRATDWQQGAWVQILATTFASCMTLGKLFNLYASVSSPTR